MLKSYFVITDKGPFYNINQDSYVVNLEHKVFAVVDGFGGSGIGDIVAKNLSEKIAQVFTQIEHDRDATLKYFFDQRRTIECNFIVNGLLEFNQNLIKDNSEKSLYQRAGASAVLLNLKGDNVSLVTVGKIYAILIRDKKLLELNQADVGRAFENNNEGFVSNYWPKSGFGLFEPLNFSIKDFKVMQDDQILLFSEGAAWGITRNKLLEITQDSNDKELIKSLFNASNDNGNRDNQTAMLLRF